MSGNSDNYALDTHNAAAEENTEGLIFIDEELDENQDGSMFVDEEAEEENQDGLMFVDVDEMEDKS